MNSSIISHSHWFGNSKGTGDSAAETDKQIYITVTHSQRETVKKSRETYKLLCQKSDCMKV